MLASLLYLKYIVFGAVFRDYVWLLYVEELIVPEYVFIIFDLCFSNWLCVFAGNVFTVSLFLQNFRCEVKLCCEMLGYMKVGCEIIVNFTVEIW